MRQLYRYLFHINLIEMDNKTLSIVSYITLIGWLVAFFVGKEKANDLLKYHLRQSFGVLILSFVLSLVIRVIAGIFPVIAGMIAIVIYLIILLYMIMGILNAAGEKKKPLPLIGEWSDKTLSFIK